MVFVSSITAPMMMGLFAPVAPGDPPGLEVEAPHDARTSAEMAAASSPAPRRRYDLFNFDFGFDTVTPLLKATGSTRCILGDNLSDVKRA
ncbi:MAG: hypothetical protein ACYCZN_07690 [Candidatus Dormibacteria bacterium]